MAGRIRTIKPEILEDAATAGLSEPAFRLFIGMIAIADDYGNLRAENAYLVGQVFWKVPSSAPIEDVVRELGAKLVQFYEVDGQRYAHIRKWSSHQKISHKGSPRVPGPSETVREPPESLARSSGDPPEILRPDHDLRSPTTITTTTTTTSIERHSAGGVATEPESGVLRIVETPSSPKRQQRKPRGRTYIPSDWQPTQATVDEYRARGVDAMACVREFRNYWLGEGGQKANWEATFCNRVETLIADGRAPAVRVVDTRPVETPEQAEARAAANWERDKVRYGIVDVPAIGVVDVGELFADLGAAKRVGGQDAPVANSVRPQRSEETEPVKRNVAQLAAK